MKNMIILLILTIPVLGICQGQDSKSFGSLEERVLFNYKKENIVDQQIPKDIKALQKILETDIGEAELSNELSKYDYVKDSAIFFNLITTKGVELSMKKNKMAQKFITQNPDSYVALYQFSALDFMYTADQFLVAYEGFNERMKNSVLGVAIKRKIHHLKMTPTGMQATDFNRRNQHDELVKLSDYRGKLVLLDFWGSWCIPCRHTHPHLKELYKKYKSKGLEIVAVANEKGSTLADRQKTWLAAIKKDDIPWVHVLNDEGTGEKTPAVAYGIYSYPTKILIDKEGKILMRVNAVHNDEMDQLIEKILNK